MSEHVEYGVIVHLRHATDGYPLCWPMHKDGTFEGSFRDDDVTCQPCRDAIEEVIA